MLLGIMFTGASLLTRLDGLVEFLDVVVVQETFRLYIIGIVTSSLI
jgi:hypothetical protein